MRFRSLRDHTTLPVEDVRRQFRNEEVRSVLPVRSAAGCIDSLLVATTSALAIVSAGPSQGDGRWLTRWAPWDVVRVVEDVEAVATEGEVRHGVDVQVDRLRFESNLPGEMGLRAMRDFVAASKERRSSLAANT
jgi:hypothetical protein